MKSKSLKKLLIFLVILIFLNFILLSYISSLNKKQDIEKTNNQKIQQNIMYTHSFTKAVCNKNNFCQDYEVFCNNNNLLRIQPITGAFIQFEKDWIDTRDDKEKEIYC
jgi:hypothetical protein